MRNLPPWQSQKPLTPFRPNTTGYPQAIDPYCDCAQCKQGLQKFRPSYGSWLDGPNVQEPSLESIKILKSKTIEPAVRCPRIKTEEAYYLAYQALQVYKKKIIKWLDPKMNLFYSRKELPFSIFDRLDKELFRSVLTRNVYLEWSPRLSPYRNAMTFRRDHHGCPRIAIKLAESLQAGSREEIIGTLIHQMIHAYFLQCCGFRNKTLQASGSGYDLEHGFEFQALLRSIEKVCPQDASPYLWDLKSHDRRPLGSRSVKPHPIIGASNCVDCYKSRVDKIDVKQWCQDAIAIAKSLIDTHENGSKKESTEKIERPTLPEPQQPDFYFIEGTHVSGPIPRAEYRSEPEDIYIEIHINHMAFPLLRDAVSPYIRELAKSPVFTNNRILTLPPTASVPSLIGLCRFLQQDSNKQVVEKNFPIIDPYCSVNAIQIKDTISTYYLALNISFLSLALESYSQLYRKSSLSDPIAVLGAIYHPELDSQSPDSNLRSWTRSWLSTRTTDSNTLYPSPYPTNLDILQTHPHYKAQCQELCQKTPLLAKDIDIVQAMIKETLEQKGLELPPIVQWPAAPYQHHLGQNPYYNLPYVPQPPQGWQTGFQQPVQAEQARLPRVPPIWGQIPNNPQAVG